MITIPDVKGKSLREAKNRFDDWGLRYDQVKEINSFNTEKGKVIKTEPPIGTQVNYGDLITIYVSKRKTYPIYIVVIAVLLLGLLLGRGTISKLIDNAKKKQQVANVCQLNCDTNGDGIPDTNLDTDGDGVCDQNCEGDVQQDGSGNSTDGKKNDNPDQKGNNGGPGSTSVRVETGTQNGNKVVRVVETGKNTTSLKYSDGKQSVEYFNSGNGTSMKLGEYVIIGNSGTITIYAGGGSGGGTTQQIDINGDGEDDVTPPDFNVTVPETYSNNPFATLNYDKKDVAKIKVMKGDQSIEDVLSDGKQITGTSYGLCGSYRNAESCNGTWTFGAWDKKGNGITQTVTYTGYDSTKPTFTIDGDLLTPKKTVTLIVKANDDNDTHQSDYYTIFYTNNKVTEAQVAKMKECTSSVIDGCKMRLTNNEHLGINNNDTYTFVVYDQAGNYETSFSKTGGSETQGYLTVENVVPELAAPTFVLDNVGWSTEKIVSIVYPDGGYGTSDYSLDGGETWEPYMDPIHFYDDNQTHEIIARVYDGQHTLTSSSIKVNKIDNSEPEMEIGLSDDGKFGVGKDKKIPATTNHPKSGFTTECFYGTHGGSATTKITNLKDITEIGQYDFKCTMTTGSGRKIVKTASNVEGFEPVNITYRSGTGAFTDEECSKDGQSCNDNKTELVRGIKKGQTLGDDPIPVRDGYKFSAWKTESGDYSAANLKPTADLTYDALWNPGQYTITWDTNGGIFNNGNESTTTKVPVGNMVTLPSESPGKAGYTFFGWWTAQEGGEKVSEIATTPTASCTYYAHWIKTEGKFNTFIESLYNNIGTHVGLKSTGDAIRFTGASPNNYVKINPNNTGAVTYRIVGLFNVNGKKMLKLVTSTSYDFGKIDETGAKFGNSALKETLNALPIASDDRVASVTWKYGEVDYLTTRYSGALEIEKSASDSFTSKIAIPYISDYGYAAKNFNDTSLGNSYSQVNNNWMMTMVGSVNTFVLDQSPSSYGDYLVHTSGHFYDAVFKTQNNTIYYTFYLSPDAEVNGGTGTKESPYLLK